MSSVCMDYRVLSFQSHVSYGFVGNKCAMPIFFLNKVNADFINSVNLCAPSNYPSHVGTRLTGEECDLYFKGLKENDLLNHRFFITGYIGQPSVLSSIGKYLLNCREEAKQFFYVCDPVMGDNNSFYVSQDLVEIYKSSILRHADLCLPNIFEFECLSGVPIHGKSDVKRGFQELHAKYNIPIIILKSVKLDKNGKRVGRSYFDPPTPSPSPRPAGADKMLLRPSHSPSARAMMTDTMTLFLSIAYENDELCSSSEEKSSSDSSSSCDDPKKAEVSNEVYSVTFPYFDYDFGGTGDTFAALITAHLIKGLKKIEGEKAKEADEGKSEEEEEKQKEKSAKRMIMPKELVKRACEIALTSLHKIIALTYHEDSIELNLLESSDTIKSEEILFHLADETFDEVDE
ncbi:pyridoxine kinase [Monocercomonoides exilis]|uniref:pyridoxine kinase n=1 Tax=Monocercomonoides exilis TaxID=2049356 RepID=UPI00355AA09E|nr:pyridoxine kinase [Monocercomonoides exilis]|eukprot:MONOS_4544.1-p1 / transcript=MONOS_4544.1 / gene=MONOS_4544 / organism=Monocercomonoides_exilis_PA203 / gene_product=pyridoxine kinase / transcript_product=pyridoxine kinase / location=Mono_scaffold00122:17751-19283(-) / protein_length=402 / sequence_SO=supercontig / SO=protein_coding / is_pseudo=false